MVVKLRTLGLHILDVTLPVGLEILCLVLSHSLNNRHVLEKVIKRGHCHGFVTHCSLFLILITYIPYTVSMSVNFAVVCQNVIGQTYIQLVALDALEPETFSVGVLPSFLAASRINNTISQYKTCPRLIPALYTTKQIPYLMGLPFYSNFYRPYYTLSHIMANTETMVPS